LFRMLRAIKYSNLNCVITLADEVCWLRYRFSWRVLLITLII